MVSFIYTHTRKLKTNLDKLTMIKVIKITQWSMKDHISPFWSFWSTGLGSSMFLVVLNLKVECFANVFIVYSMHIFLIVMCSLRLLRGYCTPGPYFWRTLCIFAKNKATSDKVSYGSGQKFSKELKKHNFTSVETIVVKLQWKMIENQYFPCFEP